MQKTVIITAFIKISIAALIIQISLILWGIIETSYGCLQLYGLAASNNSLYKITGSFLNPGPFSGFLATIIPLAFQLLLNPINNYKLLRQIIVFISWAYIFLALVILPATLSRAGWIASITGISIILVIHYQIIARVKQFILWNRKLAVFCTVGILLIFIIFCASLYHLKKDSADGRLLMWKVTSHIIAEHPLTGVGWGNFAGAYGKAQAEYFSGGNATSQEEYVAGSPDYAFNEFLQITAENGIIGLILFLLVIMLAFRSAYKNGQIGIIGSLTAFLVFACFSYPFSVWQLNILFIVLLATARTNLRNKEINMKNGKWKRYALGIVLIILAIPIVWQGKKWIEKQEAITQWREEQTYYNMEIYKETVDHYRKLYGQLRDEPKFLFELGQCLSKTEFYEESNRILQEGASLSSDPMFWNIMGKNYQTMRRYREAEECFTHAYNMIPNRLYPLYLLANLYFFSNQTAKAIATAQRVIDKEPKVMSTAISEMKAEMKEKLATFSITE